MEEVRNMLGNHAGKCKVVRFLGTVDNTSTLCWSNMIHQHLEVQCHLAPGNELQADKKSIDLHLLTENDREEEEHDASCTEEINMMEITVTDVIQPVEQDLEADPLVGANHIINLRDLGNCSQGRG